MKKLSNILLGLLSCMFILSACSPEEDNIFDDSSANRIEAAMKTYQDILVGASNGWLMEYYPNALQSYGGYNIIVSFTEDGKIQASSEIYGGGKVSESSYKLYQSAGAVLSVDTYNEVFHFFSDPDNPAGVGQDGKGMEGDFEFTIMSASKDEIVLQGKKTKNKIVMTPMPEGTVWGDYFTSILDVESQMPFTNFATTAGEVEFEVTKGSYRTLVFSHAEGGEIVSQNVAYLQCPNSIKFYSPLDLGNGKVYSELLCDTETGYYVSEDGSLVLEGQVPPLNQLLITGSWYLSYDKLGSYGQQCFDMIKQVYATNPNVAGEALYYWLLGSYKGGSFGAYFGSAVLAQGSYYAGGLYYNYQLVGEDEVVLQFALQGDSNGIFYHNYCSFHYGLMPFGYSSAKTFKLTADNPIAPTEITLTDVDNPANVITLSSSPVYFPIGQ